jgi:hypothetical protein
MAGKQLHFNTIVKNTATDLYYKCEYKAATLAAMGPDAVITVYAKACRQLADGSLVQKGRTTLLWHPTKIKNSFLVVSQELAI